MTVANPIAELLAAPLSEDSTIDTLAEQLLSAVAQSPSGHQFALDAGDAGDRQTRRLLRPLLACLAMKHAAEAGTDANIYGGHLSFRRQGPHGPVTIVGHFENKAGNSRITLQRSTPVSDARTTSLRAEAGNKFSASQPAG